MRVRLQRQVSHLCPHKEERDHGQLNASWDGDSVEFYELEKFVKGFEHAHVTHEAFNEAVAAWLSEHGAKEVNVWSSWLTAGFDVQVDSARE